MIPVPVSSLALRDAPRHLEAPLDLFSTSSGLCMRCLGGAGRKAQLWVCHCSTFQAHPSPVHPMRVAAVQPLVPFPYLRVLSLAPQEHPPELKTAFAAEH